jgi:hypothetical protein
MSEAALRKLHAASSIVSAVAALFAALFWFLSSADKLPAILEYWEPTDDDPVLRALQHGIHMSRIAAIFAGLSAVAMAVGTLIQLANARRRNWR